MMCSVDGSICGLFSFGGMVGSSCVNVSAWMCAITCALGKGPMCGLKF